MKNLIKKLFGVNDDEVLPLSVLIALGFFMGIFSATYSVAGTTLFLNNFNEQSDLPGAFIISGVIGLLSAYLFSYLQKKVDFGKLITGFSTAMLLLLAALLSGFYFNSNLQDNVYFSFVLITPFVTHLSLIFWGVFGRMFDVSQSKKIIGNVDSGQLLASIIALFSIPVLLTLLADVQSLILISFGSMGMIFLILLLIVFKKLLKPVESEKLIEKQEGNTVVGRIFKNSYILIMAAFVLMSMIAVKFVDYSFLNVASAQFEDEKGMAFFLSVFEGAIVVLSFIFQTFFTDRIIENYGLKTSLLITPVILLIFISLSSLIGLTLFENYGPQSPTFLIFFIFIALSRMFALALKDALDGPAFKLYFMPLDKSVRFDAQIKIDGIVNVFAGSVAGVFLFLFDRITWINFLHITFLIIPFGIGWFYLVIKMYDRYQNTLVATLERLKKKSRKLYSRLFDTSESSVKYLHLKKEPDIIRALEITEKVNPLFFETLASRYRKHRSEKVREFLKDKFSLFEINYAEARKIKLRNADSNEVRKLALEAIENAEKGDHLFLTKEHLSVLSRSDMISDRILVANALRFLINDSNIFLLIELLRDRNFQVKKVALKTAADLDRKETWNVILEMLGHEKMANYAIAAIIKIGEDILPALENYFHKSGNNPDVLSRIIRIYGQMKADIAYDYLFKKLDYPNHLIKREAIKALKHLNKEIKGYKRTIINATLENELNKTFWNQMILSEIPSHEDAAQLRKAVEAELQHNFEIIFSLLGILYEQRSVLLVKENFEDGSSENISFALELLNIFIDEELKPLLFPVFDDVSPSERLSKLCEEFPREAFDELHALRQIIFRESGLISNWTKVCALQVYGNLAEAVVDNTIKAQVFNDDVLVRNAALWVIKKKDKAVFHDIVTRLKKTNRKNQVARLQEEFEAVDESSSVPFMMELTLKLQAFNAFEEVSPEVLSQLLLAGKVTTIAGGETVTEAEFKNKLIIALEDGLELKNDLDLNIRLVAGDMISEVLNFTPGNWKALTNTGFGEIKFFAIDHSELFKLATTYEGLTDAFALFGRNKEGSDEKLQKA